MGKPTDKVAKEYNVENIVTIFLWDMPALVKNPGKIEQIISRFKKMNLNPEDKVVIDILKHRILKTEKGSIIYKHIFGDEAPDSNKPWFTPPDVLYAKLKKKLKSPAI